MSEIDRFKFEDKGYDFPFYNKNPYIPKWGWVVLFIALIVGTILSFINSIPILILACAVYIVPVLYFLKWDYKAIFRKLSPRDLGLAAALFAGYVIYAVIMTFVLKQFGIVSPVDVGPVSAISFVELIFAMMCEEMLKFIPLIFFLRVIYKYTSNRKLSVMVSVAIIMFMFACLHAYTPIMLVYAIFVQGIGSIFEFYGYIKTKNIFVPYLTHLFTDAFALFLIMNGIYI